MKQNRVFSMIGLAARARKAAGGEFSVEKAIKSGNAYLVIISSDASDNTKKKFSNMCKFYQVPLYFFGEKQELGHAMGKGQRSSMAVLDEGFAKAVAEKLKLEAKNDLA